jgi:molecular chaperone GrpE
MSDAPSALCPPEQPINIVSNIDQNENGPEAGPEDDSAASVDLAIRIEEILVEKAELEDALKRRQADYENYRRRVERERAETFEYATMEVLRNMLPVLDGFERALKAAPAEAGPVRDYAEGIRLLYQNLLDSLTKIGLEPVESAGKVFDPNQHHAVQKEQRDDMDDQTIMEEYQRGYKFKGKLLREAMVKVSVKQ